MGTQDWALAICLAAFWLVSAYCQHKSKGERYVRSHDPFGIIPYWNFFAPTPGTWDYSLLYRDRLATGNHTVWREIQLCSPRKAWDGIWNPGKREKKALFDIVTSLMQSATEVEADRLVLTVPYIILLDYVSAMPRPYSADATQFLLMAEEPGSGKEPFVMFNSHEHPL